MAINPAAQSQPLNNPTARANELNDPQFSNEQGYFPYDLTHQEFISPLFGLITPTMNLDTVGGDRFVHQDNLKTILNQINGNFLSTVNQYVDSFYVPLRSLYPTNYEKLIPNPTKGQDLPNAALPQFPIQQFIHSYLSEDFEGEYSLVLDGEEIITASIQSIMATINFFATTDTNTILINSFAIGRMLLLATVLSRGQLLDYLGCQFDKADSSTTSGVSSTLQQMIDRFFTAVYRAKAYSADGTFTPGVIQSVELDLTRDRIDFVTVEDLPNYEFTDLSSYRSALADIFERGHFPVIKINSGDNDYTEELDSAYTDLYAFIISLFPRDGISIDSINSASNPFQSGYISLAKVLAYQQIVAQYYTNNTVDNVFNSELFMQLLRSVMFPADSEDFTKEPTFNYNGVTTEYDYISCGASYYSLLTTSMIYNGMHNRQFVWATLMLLLRRSLRYGDYFSTARPNMLAVGQLSINVEDGKVSPIDITKNLLMQRYLNAANYIGSGFLQYYASIFGVTPSDTGTYPRFIAHRKIELQNNLVENTADNQGYQTTNLVGYSDDTAFDVFIDDFGVILSLTSYDVLPVYKSGIDNSFHFSDRFDYFNPMLQGIGDQPIFKSELIGDPRLRNSIFGYTMRNAEYKYKKSRAHGAFVNSLPGYMLGFNSEVFFNGAVDDFHIDPDFIRDKPAYLDPVVPQMTGISPAEYYHFVVSVTNVVQCARKIQATPPVLF